jgi:hypothetical protein
VCTVMAESVFHESVPSPCGCVRFGRGLQLRPGGEGEFGPHLGVVSQEAEEEF